MTLIVEILNIKNTDTFYKDLIDKYPENTFMLTNDSNSSLSYIEDDSTFNEKELHKLNIGLFASNGNTEADNPSVDPKNFHITYDASIFYPESSVQDNIINSEEQQIKFVDADIIKRFHNNDTYSAGSIFKALTKYKLDNSLAKYESDDPFANIKGLYHVKGIDFRKLREGNKEDIMKQMFMLNVECYYKIIKDFLSKYDATTLILTQIPGPMRGDFSVNFYKLIFYIFYKHLKKVSSKIYKSKKIFFQIDGFTAETDYEDLIKIPRENIKEEDKNIISILEKINVDKFISVNVKKLLNPDEIIMTLGDPEPPPSKKKRMKKSFTTKGKGSKKIASTNGLIGSTNGSNSTGNAGTNGSDGRTNGSNSTGNAGRNGSDGTGNAGRNGSDGTGNAGTNGSEHKTGPTNGKRGNVQTNNDAMLLDKFYMELEKWFDGVNLNKLFADDINSKIGDLEQLLLSIFENNKLISLNNSDKIKKIFDKFRTQQEEKIENDEYKDNKLGGSSITLDEFKKYIRSKISEIVAKNVQ